MIIEDQSRLYTELWYRHTEFCQGNLNAGGAGDVGGDDAGVSKRRSETNLKLWGGESSVVLKGRFSWPEQKKRT